MDRKETYSLLLLAGGKSKRMGKDKAKLLYQGKTFIEAILDKTAGLDLGATYLSGHEVEEESVQVVWDIYPDRGPLGGIHAGLNAVQTPYCLVLPVDVPQIPVSVLEELLKYHELHREERKDTPMILKHGDQREYLIGIYPVSMKSFIEDIIKERPMSVHRMLDQWGVECVYMDVPEHLVANINTREDYQLLLEVDEKL